VSTLWGSNGISFGPDGRLYVAQFLAGQISAVDVASGDVEVVVPQGGPVQSPDDLAFGADGSMYITDLVPGRVWRRTPAGEYTLVSDQVAVPNGIATVGDRLFVNEMKMEGRVLELFPDGGGAPRVLADGLVVGNAMQLGPDGCLYYPHMFTNQVFRVPLDGGAAELVAEDVHEPVAVRFDLSGALMVLSRGVAGFVTRIDLASGERTIIESGVMGLDNAAFDSENRMFVSSYASGGIAELHPDGRTRQIVPQGFVGPYGVAVSGGTVHVADHYRLVAEDKPEMYFFAHGITAGDGLLHTTSQYGDVRTHDRENGSTRVRANGLNRPVGLAVRADGTLVVAETGAGRVVAIGADDAVTVLAEGLASPVDVAFDGEQGYVSDEERGAVLRLADGSPVVEGLSAPQGLAVHDGELFVVETGKRRLLAVDLETGELRAGPGNLPVGLPPGVTRADPELFVHGMPGVPHRFAGLAVGPDGTLHVSANAEGGVLRLSPADLEG
jgi:sugar lactone lactonase YvrE